MEQLEESWWRQNDLLKVLSNSMRGCQTWIDTGKRVEERGYVRSVNGSLNKKRSIEHIVEVNIYH